MNRLISMAAWAGLIVALLAPHPVCADVLLGGHDWDPNPGPDAWTNRYGSTILATPSTGGDTGGWLSVTFPAAGAETGLYDVAYTKATNLYTGTWSTDMWVQMDFWASNQSPAALQVQWQSSGNTDIWSYALTPPGTGVWTTVGASFGDWTSWQYTGAASEAQYLSDLASIDWIGVYIYRNGDDLQVYGLDDVDLMVPEPAESLMLAFALMITGLSLRRKRVESPAFVG